MERTKTNAIEQTQPSDATKKKIVKMLVSGEWPVDAEIARACKVPVCVVKEMLEKDPELRRLRLESQEEMAQMIEKSAVNLAINGRNEIARQKSQEFLLKKLVPNKYGDDADDARMLKSFKRILLAKELPTIPVDENGIPIAQSKSPLEPELIEVK